MSHSSAHAAGGRLLNGRLGMWWFLASEIAVFGGLIAVYVLNRMRHAEWAHEAEHTWFVIGAVNTIILLTSSLTVVLAHSAAERRDRGLTMRYLGVTLLLGLAFLVFKAIEYTKEIGEGIVPGTNLFWSFYFLMTGLHALHVIAGLVAFTTVLYVVSKGTCWSRVEAVGIYWHFVDIVWIFLFPLLYITR
jgi:heme/copper-type cytochrome/quinol oxidase subunit 3